MVIEGDVAVISFQAGPRRGGSEWAKVPFFAILTNASPAWTVLPKSTRHTNGVVTSAAILKDALANGTCFARDAS
jgi:hypothetical protein